MKFWSHWFNNFPYNTFYWFIGFSGLNCFKKLCYISFILTRFYCKINTFQQDKQQEKHIWPGIISIKLTFKPRLNLIFAGSLRAKQDKKSVLYNIPCGTATKNDTAYFISQLKGGAKELMLEKPGNFAYKIWPIGYSSNDLKWHLTWSDNLCGICSEI